MRKAFVFATIVAVICRATNAQPHLVFDHKIGSEWSGNNQWMSFVAISSDGSTIASDGNIPDPTPDRFGLWKFPEGEFIHSVAGRPLAISSDFHYVSTETSVADLIKTPPPTPESRQQRVYDCAAFSPNGELVALVCGRSEKKSRLQITVSRTADRSLVTQFSKRFTASLAFHPNGEILASGHWNNVTLWNVRTGSQLALLTHVPRPKKNDYDRDGRYIYGIAFSPDGNLLAAGSDDGELQIWDVGNRKLLHSVEIGYGYVSNPAFSPDGSLIAAGTYGDGTLTLLDMSSANILSQIKVSMFGCGSVAWSPDGKYVATPSNGGQIGSRKFDRGGSIRVFRLEK